jgi:hypothetical protein
MKVIVDILPNRGGETEHDPLIINSVREVLEDAPLFKGCHVEVYELPLHRLARLEVQIGDMLGHINQAQGCVEDVLADLAKFKEEL